MTPHACILYTLTLVLVAHAHSKSKCDPGQVEDRGYLGLGVFLGCDDCPTGTYQTGNTCEKCGIGTYNNLEKQTSCSPCPAGKYADKPGSARCEGCKPGYFSHPGSHTCEKCSPGTFSNSPASESCSVCPGGSFASVSGSTKCTKCPNGKTSTAASISASNCTGACSAGFIHTLVNGAVKCEECGAGLYSLEGALHCIPCPNGTASVQGSGSCVPCSPGMFARWAGTPTCTQCPPGTVTKPERGSTHCTPCQANTYSNSNHTACLKCPRGLFSGPGARLCETCPPGFYLSTNVDTNVDRCVECPEDTSSNPGAVGAHECYNPGYTHPTSGTEYMSTSPPRLTSRHIIGISFSSLGIATILCFVLFIFYWSYRRRTVDRHLSSRPNHRCKAKLPRGLKFGRSSRRRRSGAELDYSSCNELRTADNSTSCCDNKDQDTRTSSKIDPELASTPVQTKHRHGSVQGGSCPGTAEEVLNNPGAV